MILPLHGRMYAAALAITGSADDAADAVQTAMMRVWEGIADGNRPTTPAAYCIAAVRNTSLSALADSKKLVSCDNGCLPEPGIAADAEKRIELSEAVGMLNNLSYRERKAVEMNAFAGCSADEIADALDISTSNARQILSRARRHLRSLF